MVRHAGSGMRRTRWWSTLAGIVYAPLARFLAVVAFALIALVLGGIGLHQYLTGPHPPKGYGRGFWDIVYYDLQLPVFSSAPAEGAGPYPVTLGVARILAPLGAFLAAIGTLFLLLGEQWRRFLVAIARGHAIVAGDGPVGLEFVRNLRLEKRTVVVVSSSADTLAQARRGGALTVQGDPADQGTLKAAGMARAESLYACTSQSTANGDIAVLTWQIPLTAKRALCAFVLVPNAELGAELQARRIGMSANPSVQMVFFAIEDIAARRLFDSDKYPLTPAGGSPARVVIVGFGPLGQAVLRETARRQLALRSGSKAEVVIRNATEADVAAVTAAFPVISDACSVAYGEEAELPSAGEYTAFVCLDNEEEALREGLRMARLLADGCGRVVICVSGSSPFVKALVSRTGLLEDLGGRFSVFTVIPEACVPERIERVDEQLARSIHEAYVAQAKARGETEQTNPSMVPWERLPANLRQANLAQAADIGNKLGAIGAVVIPESAAVPAFAFTDREVEFLSQLEHERWMRERTDTGWTYGLTRDDRRKVHPDLKDWADLSEADKDKDRNAVRTLPATLHRAGYQILRLPPEP
jgi:voltage-gated potassium channel Kch